MTWEEWEVLTKMMEQQRKQQQGGAAPVHVPAAERLRQRVG